MCDTTNGKLGEAVGESGRSERGGEAQSAPFSFCTPFDAGLESFRPSRFRPLKSLQKNTFFSEFFRLISRPLRFLEQFSYFSSFPHRTKGQGRRRLAGRPSLKTPAGVASPVTFVTPCAASEPEEVFNEHHSSAFHRRGARFLRGATGCVDVGGLP